MLASSYYSQNRIPDFLESLFGCTSIIGALRFELLLLLPPLVYCIFAIVL